MTIHQETAQALASSEPVPYPFSDPVGLEVGPAHERLRTEGGLISAQLPFSKPTVAW